MINKKIMGYITLLAAFAAIGSYVMPDLFKPDQNMRATPKGQQSQNNQTLIGNNSSIITNVHGRVTINNIQTNGDKSEACIETNSGDALQWLCDKYLAVKVLNEATGALVAQSPYKITLSIKNMTSMLLTISRVSTVEFDSNRKRNFTGEIHATYHFMPHEKKEMKLSGNEYLPYYLHIELFHNFSSMPSAFDFDLKTRVVKDKNCVRKLATSSIKTGLDGAEAVIKAATQLNDDDYRFMAAFPGNYVIGLEKASRLEFIHVEDWVVNFCSPIGKMKTFLVSNKSVNFAGVSGECEYHDSPLPLIGNQEALIKASQSNIICSNSNELRALSLSCEDKERTVWILPYLDAEDRRIIFDAVTGENLTTKLGGI